MDSQRRDRDQNALNADGAPSTQRGRCELTGCHDTGDCRSADTRRHLEVAPNSPRQSGSAVSTSRPIRSRFHESDQCKDDEQKREGGSQLSGRRQRGESAPSRHPRRFVSTQIPPPRRRRERQHVKTRQQRMEKVFMREPFHSPSPLHATRRRWVHSRLFYQIWSPRSMEYKSEK